MICTANGERAYEQSLQMLRPLGVLVCVGIPNVPFKLPATPFDMIVKGNDWPILRRSETYTSPTRLTIS